MQRYEYGGYAKGIYYDNFVMSRQLNGYSKLQYKRMTFDVAGGLFFMRDKSITRILTRHIACHSLTEQLRRYNVIRL